MNPYRREQILGIFKDARDMLEGVIDVTNDELVAHRRDMIEARDDWARNGSSPRKPEILAIMDFLIEKADQVRDDLVAGRRRHDDLLCPPGQPSQTGNPGQPAAR